MKSGRGRRLRFLVTIVFDHIRYVLSQNIKRIKRQLFVITVAKANKYNDNTEFKRDHDVTSSDHVKVQQESKTLSSQNKIAFMTAKKIH